MTTPSADDEQLPDDHFAPEHLAPGHLADVVRQSAHQVLVLIARHDALLLDSDYQLWRDLHTELRESDVQLLPVRALPAA